MEMFSTMLNVDDVQRIISRLYYSPVAPVMGWIGCHARASVGNVELISAMDNKCYYIGIKYNGAEKYYDMGADGFTQENVNILSDFFDCLKYANKFDGKMKAVLFEFLHKTENE